MPSQVEFSAEIIDAAKNLVNAGRVKKHVENRCLAAFDSAGNQIIDDEEILKLAVDVTTSVELFVGAGEYFDEKLNKAEMAKGGN